MWREGSGGFAAACAELKSRSSLTPTAGAESKFIVVTKHPRQKQGNLTWTLTAKGLLGGKVL